MRSVFTVNIKPSKLPYPSTNEILNKIHGFGWTPVEAIDYDEEKLVKYHQRMAKELFIEMPEIAQQEKDSLIYYGFLADDKTKFVITRVVESQITFRLLHPELPKLQNSTRKLVKKNYLIAKNKSFIG